MIVPCTFLLRLRCATEDTRQETKGLKMGLFVCCTTLTKRSLAADARLFGMSGRSACCTVD